VAELPPTSLSVVRNLQHPYDWQLGLEDACLEAKKTGPVFACVIAETGSGKTLGGLRAANALTGGKLRLTLAMGLRSLTKQSADSMLEDADLNPKDLLVAVGNPQTLALAEQARAMDRARFGSESAEGADADVSLPGGADSPDLSWAEGFCTEKEAPALWGPKSLAMLSAPVLCCTADYLVSSSTMLRGGDAKLYLRLASADLMLDEIDAYSASDLQSIGKLAFLCGLHGKNIVVMSATMGPAVQQGLYAAWSKGIGVRATLRGTSAAHACVFSSNTIASRVSLAQAEPLAPAAWTEYAGEVAAAYALVTASRPRRKALVTELDVSADQDAAFECALLAAVALHQANHLEDPQTGVRVSTGFIRLNTAKNAWRLAKYLADRPQGDGPDIRFVAYHSKFPRTYLGVLDSTLGSLTNRKRPGAFLQTPDLRRALAGTTSKDLLVVVCTTTLIETGRDFDFDWCVLEPRAVRGEIQAVGRVLRHRRDAEIFAPNVALLSHPLRVLSPPVDISKESVWSRPGIEDELGLRVRQNPPALFSSAPAATGMGKSLVRKKSAAASYVRSAREALPVAAWEQGMDAGVCLRPAEDYAQNRLGFLEQRVQGAHLNGATDWHRGQSVLPPSLHFYLNTLAGFNRLHAEETPFRGRREEQLVFMPHGGRVTYFDEQAARLNRPAGRLPAPGVEWLAVASGRALLPDLEERADALFSGKDHHVDGCSLRCRLTDGGTQEMEWSPLLGFKES
jgi:hypothetical protein